MDKRNPRAGGSRVDEVSGGLIEELAALVILGGTAFLFTAFSDFVAVKDGKVLINGIPQN